MTGTLRSLQSRLPFRERNCVGNLHEGNDNHSHAACRSKLASNKAVSQEHGTQGSIANKISMHKLTRGMKDGTNRLGQIPQLDASHANCGPVCQAHQSPVRQPWQRSPYEGQVRTIEAQQLGIYICGVILKILANDWLRTMTGGSDRATLWTGKSWNDRLVENVTVVGNDGTEKMAE